MEEPEDSSPIRRLKKKITSSIETAKDIVLSFNILYNEYKELSKIKEINGETIIKQKKFNEEIIKKQQNAKHILHILEYYNQIYKIPFCILNELEISLYEIKRILSSNIRFNIYEYKSVKCMLCRQINEHAYYCLDLNEKCSLCQDILDIRWCELCNCGHKFHIDCIIRYMNHMKYNIIIKEKKEVCKSWLDLL